MATVHRDCNEVGEGIAECGLLGNLRATENALITHKMSNIDCSLYYACTVL